MELKKMKIRIVSPKRKNPRLAALASLFFAGLGQVYNGDIGQLLATEVASMDIN
jgi:TM2 domain-containing membrane protein YozV